VRTLILALAVAAQINVYAATYTSFSSFTALDAGPAPRIISDSSGNSYIALNASPVSVLSIAPDGSVRFKKPVPVIYETYPSSITDLALAPDGFVVAFQNQVSKFDFQGNGLFDASFVDLGTYGPNAVNAIATDAIGNTYVAAIDNSGEVVVFKLDKSGKRTGTFQSDQRGLPASIAVDPSGAIYVAANGLLQTGDFVMKISAALDRVVYRTVLGTEYNDQVWSIAVDASGSAYVGGAVTIDASTTPLMTGLSSIGFPLLQDSANVSSSPPLLGYLVKLNPDGASLAYGVSLCGSGCIVEGIVLMPDGRIHAVADAPTTLLFTVSASGDRVERSQAFDGVGESQFDGPQRLSDLTMGANGSIRVLSQSIYSTFPVPYAVFGGISIHPVLIEVPAQLPQSDLEISVVLPSPPVYRPQVWAFMQVTVKNNGPSDAESLLVTAPYSANVQFVNCLPSIAAMCHIVGSVIPDVAVIPKLAAGDEVSIQFEQTWLRNPLPSAAVSFYVTSLSSDSATQNNFASISAPISSGVPAYVQTPQIPSDGGMPPKFIEFLRNDYPGARPNTTNTTWPELSVTVPSPQRWNGNWWYFNSWADGSVDNPRTFLTGTGLSPPQTQVLMRTAQPIGTDPPSLDLVTLAGQTPQPAYVNLFKGPIVTSWTVGKPTANWLTISMSPSAADYGASQRLMGSADITGLGPGLYTASVPVILPDKSTMEIPVSLEILAAPPVITGVLDAASYQGDPFAGAQIVTIFGTGLGPEQPQGGQTPVAGEMPVTLGGTTVSFGDNSLSPLLYVQSNQVTAIIPNLGTKVPDTPRPLRVTVNRGALTASADLHVINLKPSLFTADASGRGQLAVINQDGSINSPLHPALRGTIVSFYGEGFAQCGDPFGERVSPYAPPAGTSVLAQIGGKPADVYFFGPAAELPCMQQISIRVPDDSDTGDSIPVKLESTWAAADTPFYPTQNGVSIAVQ
jgi:uncharacterized protein (TIGR03437 family)